MKNYISSIIILALIYGCSADESITTMTGTELEQVPIAISMAGDELSFTEETRGAGPLGSGTEKNPTWHGEDIYLFMTQKGTTMPAIKDGTYNEPVLFNTLMKTPGGEEEEAVLADGFGYLLAHSYSPIYYPLTGLYDFWGCYFDNAIAGEPIVTEGTVTVPIKLDGSQDIMCAKALLTNDQKKRLSAVVCDSAYSAYSAHRGLTPVIQMRHALTRIKIYVKPAEESLCDPNSGVIIDDISINIPTEGKLVVAYSDENRMQFAQQLILEPSTKKFISLPGVAGASSSTVFPINLEWNSVYQSPLSKSLGEGIMLVPLEYGYNTYVKAHQVKNGRRIEKEFRFNIERPNRGAFQPGSVYNVYITVYDLEEAEAEAKGLNGTYTNKGITYTIEEE